MFKVDENSEILYHYSLQNLNFYNIGLNAKQTALFNQREMKKEWKK